MIKNQGDGTVWDVLGDGMWPHGHHFPAINATAARRQEEEKKWQQAKQLEQPGSLPASANIVPERRHGLDTESRGRLDLDREEGSRSHVLAGPEKAEHPGIHHYQR